MGRGGREAARTICLAVDELAGNCGGEVSEECEEGEEEGRVEDCHIDDEETAARIVFFLLLVEGPRGSSALFIYGCMYFSHVYAFLRISIMSVLPIGEIAKSAIL